MKRFFLKTLRDALFVWITLTVMTIASAVLYTILNIAQVSQNISLLISFVAFVGLIMPSLFLGTWSFVLSPLSLTKSIFVTSIPKVIIVAISVSSILVITSASLNHYVSFDLVLLTIILTIGLVIGVGSELVEYKFSKRRRLEQLEHLVADLSERYQYRRRFPKNDDVLYHLEAGLLLYRQRHYDEALSQYEEVISIEPREVAAYLGAGLVLWKTKRPKEAQRVFRKAKELVNDSKEDLLFVIEKRYLKILNRF